MNVLYIVAHYQSVGHHTDVLLVLQQSEIDMDMMVDATLMLWKKCKEIFAKYQTGSTDNPKYLQRMDNPSKVRGR